MKVPPWPVTGFLALLAPLVQATDVEYGCDGAPYLSRNAALILRVDEPRSLPAGEAEASLFDVRRVETLRGEEAPGGQLTIAISRGLGLDKTSDLDGAIVFLSKPLSTQEKAALGIAREEPIHRVVSGSFGVIPARNGRAQAALREYLKATSAQTLSWAEKHATAEDPLTRRWALLAAEAQGMDDPRVVSLLGRWIRSAKLEVQERRFAVELLRSSPEAHSILRELFEDVTTDPDLRFAALRAVASMSGGQDLLLALMLKKDDSYLASTASKLLAALEQDDRGLPLSIEREKALLVALKAASLGTRRDAAAECGRYASSKGLIHALKAAAMASEEPSINVRLAAVDSLSRIGSADAQEALLDVAEEDEAPELVRGSAILCLGRGSLSCPLDRLMALPDRLKSTKLQRLTRGLLPGSAGDK